MIRHILSLAVAATACVVAGSQPVLAQSLVLDITGGIGASPSGATTGGWSFTVTSPVTIDGLGVWDQGANGLTESHQVGLWTSGATLLASATVDNSATAVASTDLPGDWLFTSIAPLTLTPGSYVVGAAFLNVDPDLAIINGSATTIPGITFGQALQNVNSGLNFPNAAVAVNDGVFGPNLLLAQAPAGTPEPGGIVLLCSIGGVALSCRRHRK